MPTSDTPPLKTALPSPLFPYMFWAHEGMIGPTWSLSQSGMPAPAGAWLAELAGTPDGSGAGGDPAAAWDADLMHPTGEAQPGLEAAIAADLGVPAERVLVTLGASMSMAIIASWLFRPTADGPATVAVDVPSYEPFRQLPPYFGAHCAPVTRRFDEGWRLDPGDVAEALGLSAPEIPDPEARTAAEAVGLAPRHLFFTNPSNPTGQTEDLAGLEALGAVIGPARTPGRNAMIVSEAYMPLSPIQTCAARDIPHAISLGSLTKAYGLGALRIGWIVLGEAWASARAELVGHTYLAYVDPPTASQRRGLQLMPHLAALLAPYKAFTSESRPELFAGIAESPHLSGPMYDIGLVAFPRVEPRTGETVADTQDLATFLRNEHDLGVTPGEHFGAPGHLRLGFGAPAEHVREATARLVQGVAAWHARQR